MSRQPGHFCRGRVAHFKPKTEQTSQVALPSVEGGLFYPAQGFQFGNVPADLSFGNVKEGGDVPVGHIAFPPVFRKAVYLQKKDLGIPVHLPVQIDRSGYPDALKIPFRWFHASGHPVTSCSSTRTR